MKLLKAFALGSAVLTLMATGLLAAMTVVMAQSGRDDDGRTLALQARCAVVTELQLLLARDEAQLAHVAWGEQEARQEALSLLAENAHSAREQLEQLGALQAEAGEGGYFAEAWMALDGLYTDRYLPELEALAAAPGGEALPELWTLQYELEELLGASAEYLRADLEHDIEQRQAAGTLNSTLVIAVGLLTGAFALATVVLVAVLKATPPAPYNEL